jgi:hypothetical protein
VSRFTLDLHDITSQETTFFKYFGHCHTKENTFSRFIFEFVKFAISSMLCIIFSYSYFKFLRDITGYIIPEFTETKIQHQFYIHDTLRDNVPESLSESDERMFRGHIYIAELRGTCLHPPYYITEN